MTNTAFRLIVCGGRHYKGKKFVFMALDLVYKQHPRLTVIEGGASGADSFAALWCFAQPSGSGVDHLEVKAEWRKYGRAAGSARNRKMLDLNPDLVLAFPGGRGTANMVSIARVAGIRVIHGEQLVLGSIQL